MLPVEKYENKSWLKQTYGNDIKKRLSHDATLFLKNCSCADDLLPASANNY